MRDFVPDYLALAGRFAGVMASNILHSPALNAALNAYLRNTGTRHFRADDAFAVRHGWRIGVRQRGLGRTYRDPRFDLLRQCPDCRGRGLLDGHGSCRSCDGTGRIRLSGAGKLQMVPVPSPGPASGHSPRYPVRPVATPNPVVIGWRWRWEAGAAVAAALSVAVLLHLLGPALTIATLGACAGLASRQPSRRWLRRRAWCVITAHRVRTGCAQAYIRSADGKLPAVLATHSRPYGERVLLWCWAGTSADDLAVASGMLAAACWASEVRVLRDNRRAQLVALDVVRLAEPIR